MPEQIDNYWIVATNPTQRWAGARGIYVATSDAAYIAWDAIEGNDATNIETEALLFEVIANIAASIGRANTQAVLSSVPVALCAATVPLPWYTSLALSAVEYYLPQANTPLSPVLGKVHYVKNGIGADVTIKAHDTSTTVAVIKDGTVTAFILINNNTTNGTFVPVPLPSADPHDATNLITGTLPNARLPANIALAGNLSADGNTTLGNASGDAVTMNAKAITRPNAPCVSASNSAADLNVTGDGTAVTVEFDTEQYDIGGDFASHTFTFPFDCKVIVAGSVILLGLTAGTHIVNLEVVSSNRAYFVNSGTAAATAQSTPLAVVVQGEAGDTIFIRLAVSGGTKVVDVQGAASIATFITVGLLG